MTKVLVIGSNSFSGAHYIDYLLDNTSYQVVGISRSPEKSKLYLPYKKNKNLSRFKFYQLDLNKNLREIMELIDKEKFPYIVNFASQSMVGESWTHPEHWYKTNVLSMVEFADQLRTRTFLKNYVHISTPKVYGNCSGSVTEDAPHNPSSPYAGSRSAADVFLNLLLRQYKFPVSFTRAANVYGPGQQLFKIIPRTVVFLNKGKKVPLHGGGYARRSFIHIKDVCEGTLHVMEKAKPGEIYHLSTDDLIIVKDIVAKICELQGKDYESSVEVVGTRPGLDLAYILDSSKAKKDFGWQATTPLDEGLQEYVQWAKENWVELSKEPMDYIHQE